MSDTSLMTEHCIASIVDQVPTLILKNPVVFFLLVPLHQHLHCKINDMDTFYTEVALGRDHFTASMNRRIITATNNLLMYIWAFEI